MLKLSGYPRPCQFSLHNHFISCVRLKLVSCFLRWEASCFPAEFCFSLKGFSDFPRARAPLHDHGLPDLRIQVRTTITTTSTTTTTTTTTPTTTTTTTQTTTVNWCLNKGDTCFFGIYREFWFLCPAVKVSMVPNTWHWVLHRTVWCWTKKGKKTTNKKQKILLTATVLTGDISCPPFLIDQFSGMEFFVGGNPWSTLVVIRNRDIAFRKKVLRKTFRVRSFLTGQFFG